MEKVTPQYPDSVIDSLEAMSGDGSALWNITDDVWHFSRNFLTLHGYGQATSNRSFPDTFHTPEDRFRVEEFLSLVKSGNPPEYLEYRVDIDHTAPPRLLRLSCTPVESGDTFHGGILFHVRDITTREDLEGQLRFQSMLLDQIRDNITVTDLDGVITYVNETGCRTLGAKREELIGKPIDIYGDDDINGISQRHLLEETIQNGRWRGEVHNTSADGEDVIMDVRTRVLVDDDGTPLGAFGVSSDVTEKKRMEYELAENERLFRSIFELAAVGIAIVAPDGRFIRVNQRLSDILGYSAEELGTMNFSQVTHPEDLHLDKEYISKVIAGEIDTFNIEKRYIHKDGHSIWISLYSSVIRDSKRQPELAIAVINDISARVKAEGQIRENLEEKNLLLREIHHRVKNNLQIISSLIALQAENFSDPKTTGIFTDSSNRIDAMALIHEHLYQTPDIATISFEEYANDLVKDIAVAYGATERVAVNLIDCRISLDIDTAIPCGLIIQELVANSFKHAFPSGGRGSLKVGMSYLKDEGRCLLWVSDSGPGLPESFSPEQSRSLGLRLVETLATQLDGEVFYRNRKGTTVEVAFPHSC